MAYTVLPKMGGGESAYLTYQGSYTADGHSAGTVIASKTLPKGTYIVQGTSYRSSSSPADFAIAVNGTVALTATKNNDRGYVINETLTLAANSTVAIVTTANKGHSECMTVCVIRTS